MWSVFILVNIYHILKSSSISKVYFHPPSPHLQVLHIFQQVHYCPSEICACESSWIPPQNSHLPCFPISIYFKISLILLLHSSTSFCDAESWEQPFSCWFMVCSTAPWIFLKPQWIMCFSQKAFCGYLSGEPVLPILQGILGLPLKSRLCVFIKCLDCAPDASLRYFWIASLPS